MLGGEGKRRGATGRVADEMETLEAMKVSLTKNPFHLGIETEVRRWFVLRVDLEVLHNRVDTRLPPPPATPRTLELAGSTPPGRNITACRVDIAASLLAVLLRLNHQRQASPISAARQMRLARHPFVRPEQRAEDLAMPEQVGLDAYERRS